MHANYNTIIYIILHFAVLCCKQTGLLYLIKVPEGYKLHNLKTHKLQENKD